MTACNKTDELDPNPLDGELAFYGMAPNPVMRGGALRIMGSNLDKVTAVQFAGDVTVTDFQKLSKGTKIDTLEVIVPLEGPVVGKVTIVSADRALTSFSDLEFSEPIEVDSFTPATVLSGDVLTFKGEYLNVVKEVIFTGTDVFVTEFSSQSRHELSLVVPANAISGPVILSDVNEIEDQNTIPNHIYTKTDLVVGKPSVQLASKATYKSGDVITVKGAHLDMIANVALPQVPEVTFTVAEDAASIKFNLPPKAADGMMVLTSFAGDTFEAGEIETVSVTELSVKPLAEDGRFKAGFDVEITGADLDLVSKVEFTGAEASWYLSNGKIVATQPDAAKDGPVTVTLDSGKQAYSEDIEVVKPVATGVDKTEAVAGVDVVEVYGTDLDLVTTVVIGNKEQKFIDCTFELKNAEDGSQFLAVAIPAQAYSGPLTLTAASTYETVTEDIDVTYDEAVSVSFETPSFGLGQMINITGQNLMQVEQVFVKGKKVTNYALRTDDAMSFGIPDGVGPGVYRLDLVLIDGTELTWPVPFEITAPFTETFIWQGNHDLAGWGANLEAGPEDGFVQAGLQVGDIVRIYYTTYNDSWQFKLQAGHWDAINLEVLGGANTVNPDYAASGSTFFSFEVTDDIYNQLTLTGQGWGYSFVINGEGAIITGISMIHFGAAEQRTTIWEGSVAVDWSGNTPGAEGSMGALSWGGYDWSSVEAGTVLALAFDRTADEVQIRLGDGSWNALPGTEDPYRPDGSELKVELSSAMLSQLVSAGGLVVTGQGYTLKEVALVTTGPAVPSGQTIWEGSQAIDWSGNTPGAEGSMGALSWGGYDWSTVEAGTVLVLEFDRTADEVQIRLGDGSWNALPGTEDPYKPEGDSLEVELTADMLSVLVANGGLVITGQGYTLTTVILK